MSEAAAAAVAAEPGAAAAPVYRSAPGRVSQAPPDPVGVAYLAARLDVVEARIRRTLTQRRGGGRASSAGADSGTDSDADSGAGSIEEHLAAAEAVADHAETLGARPRLRALARRCSLDVIDVELLLIALAPEAEPRFGQLYSYLHDDPDRRRATVGLALELCGAAPMEGAYRSRLLPGAALSACGLLAVTDTDQPFPFRTLRVPDRVVCHLLGDDGLDPALSGVARVLQTVPRLPIGSGAGTTAERLTACLASDPHSRRPAYLRGTRDGAVLDIAVAAASAAAALAGDADRVLAVDLARIPPGTDAGRMLAGAATEAWLRGCGLVVGPVQELPPEPADRARILPEVCGLPIPTVLYGDVAWDARCSESLPLLFDVPAPDHQERLAWWHDALGSVPEAATGAADAADITAAAQALSLHKLPPHRMRTTVDAVIAQAAAQRHPVTTADLLRTARLHHAADLERVARRVEPSADWDSLVLPDEPIAQLHELAARHRHRGTVLADWRLRAQHGRGRGVAALFTGESGTGKTLAAEVLAAVAGVDLYVVNLATVVDKYIGETEKNLERIFAAAAGAQGMVFFDEADALFGKRSKVNDAHDRFANIETAYLLQRLETFDGLAVLATNLSGNVDQAFLRRLDTIIHFPRPGADQRVRLWDLGLGPGVPRAADLDLARAAEAFELTGGAIRACAITASYRAARTGQPVTTADLFAAVRAEYQKLGRLIDESEFAVSPL